jgi:anthranilate phosphoribosyltransferase
VFAPCSIYWADAKSGEAQAQVLGYFRPKSLMVAETLMELGTEHAFVVHGTGKLDEISLAGPTIVSGTAIR